MRFKTRAIELEAVKYDGGNIPDFAEDRISANRSDALLTVETDEGERQCNLGDYFVLTDAGQVLVRAGAIFEAIFEPVA
ncbi:MAG: hypothetical protein OEX14_04470 [Paracoccaceae bacterium]|nr:hypothetical protein [Paracoccaceae bacterium]